MRPSSTKIVSTLGAGTKRGPTKSTKSKFLPTKATPGLSGTISRSGAASPALSGIVSPSLNPTLSAAEQATENAKELRAPIVHELAVREMSFEELRAKWLGDDDKEFKTALDTVADFDKKLQKYTLKRAYWKEIDAYKYDYELDDDRQTAIDNAIRNFDRLRLGATDPLWDKLNPKEERGKGKCLSKLLPKLAKAQEKQEKPAATTPQIKVNDAEDSSGSKNGDGSQSGVEKKKPAKKASEPMSRSSSQTKQPVRKIEKKWVGKKAATPKVSPTKAAAKATKDKNGRVLSKEFISDSDSSSEDTPLSTTVPRRALEKEKAIEKANEEREKERERLREEKEKERQREREREREIEREKERERDRELEREREREREQREKDRLAEKQREREKREAQASAPKPKPKQSAAKDSIKAQVIARPAAQKRSREEDDESSSSSGTPLIKRNNREIKAAGTAPSHSTVSYKRPPSDYSSQSSRSNSYAGNGYSKNKNTSPTKSSPLASSPPTNASDLEDRDRDFHRGRNVMVANGNINVKKRKVDSSSTDGDAMDSIRAEKKRQRLSNDLLNDARLFKKFYEVYQRLHYELQADKNFSKEKYDTLIRQRKRLEDLKEQIYSQIPHEVC